MSNYSNVISVRDLAKHVGLSCSRCLDEDNTEVMQRLMRFSKYVYKILDINKIHISKTCIFKERIEESVALYKQTNKMPPIVYDEVSKIIVDGTYRLLALKQLGFTQVGAFVGTLQYLDHASDAATNQTEEEIHNDESDLENTLDD